MTDLKKIHSTRTPAAFIEMVAEKHPEVHQVLHKANHDVPNRSHAIEPYQAALLYLVAAQFNRTRAKVLEIGTRYGYSASVLSQACPRAQITTVDASDVARNLARENLKAYKNVTCVKAKSWNWLEQVEDGVLSLIFVDGDHDLVEKDLAWWNKLRPGGLMVFHDYTPSRFPAVVAAVHHLKAEPDIVFVQEGTDKGIAGIYK